MIYGNLHKHHPFYMAWCNMKTRCDNPKSGKWEHYGGRGISYDPKWKSFECFYLDMFPFWFEGLTLERKDNNGNYCQDNCDWVPQSVQNGNRRPRRFNKYCIRGHILDEDNIVYIGGHRRCKICRTDYIDKNRDNRNSNARVNRLSKKLGIT